MVARIDSTDEGDGDALGLGGEVGVQALRGGVRVRQQGVCVRLGNVKGNEVQPELWDLFIHGANLEHDE